MKPLLLALPGNTEFAACLLPLLGADLGVLAVRAFPDGESYVRIDSPVANREVVLLCTPNSPDAKVLPLLFTAATHASSGPPVSG